MERSSKDRVPTAAAAAAAAAGKSFLEEDKVYVNLRSRVHPENSRRKSIPDTRIIR